MKKTLKRRFVIFTMLTVTLLLTVLATAISGFSYLIFDRQSDKMLSDLARFDTKPLPPAPFKVQMSVDNLSFFSIFLDSDKNIVEINTDRASIITQEDAKEYLSQTEGRESGKIGRYKYLKKNIKYGEVYFFMDISRDQNSFYTVVFSCVIIAVICWFAVLIFAVFLSGKVVNPIVKNIEKQKQFITNAGHELKTPLAVIQSNNDASELILGKNKYSQNINSQIKRMNTLVSNLLTLAKFEEEIFVTTEHTDISHLLTTTLSSYKESILKKNITLKENISPSVTVLSDAERFTCLISLLIDNAVKYTPESKQISVTLSDSAVIQIENDCLPSEDNDTERLFERFYRGDSARTQESSSSGYGIGLPSARAIADSLNISLKAQYITECRIRFTLKFK